MNSIFLYVIQQMTYYGKVIVSIQPVLPLNHIQDFFEQVFF